MAVSLSGTDRSFRNANVCLSVPLVQVCPNSFFISLTIHRASRAYLRTITIRMKDDIQDEDDDQDERVCFGSVIFSISWTL